MAAAMAENPQPYFDAQSLAAMQRLPSVTLKF